MEPTFTVVFSETVFVNFPIFWHRWFFVGADDGNLWDGAQQRQLFGRRRIVRRQKVHRLLQKCTPGHLFAPPFHLACCDFPCDFRRSWPASLGRLPRPPGQTHHSNSTPIRWLLQEPWANQERKTLAHHLILCSTGAQRRGCHVQTKTSFWTIVGLVCWGKEASKVNVLESLSKNQKSAWLPVDWECTTRTVVA